MTHKAHSTPRFWARLSGLLVSRGLAPQVAERGDRRTADVGEVWCSPGRLVTQEERPGCGADSPVPGPEVRPGVGTFPLGGARKQASGPAWGTANTSPDVARSWQ